MSQVTPLPNFGNDRNNAYIKKPNRISQIAQMLEKQIGVGGGRRSEISDNRPVTDDETSKEVNIVDLFQKKPTFGKKKRKPTFGNKFKKEFNNDNE